MHELENALAAFKKPEFCNQKDYPHLMSYLKKNLVQHKGSKDVFGFYQEKIHQL